MAIHEIVLMRVLSPTVRPAVRPAVRCAVVASLLALLLLASVLAQAAPRDCEINGKSVNPNNGNTTAGLTGIMRCVDGESKQLLREQEIQNGEFFGIERFYEKGKLQRDFRTNVKGNKEGVAKTFEDGVLVADELYQAGSSVGLQKFYFKSGLLRRLSFYEVTRPVSAASPFIQTQEIAAITLNENGKLREIRCAKRPVIEFEKISDRKLCGFAGASQLELFAGNTLELQKSYLDGEEAAATSYWENGKVRRETVVQGARYLDLRFNQTGVKVKEISYQIVAGQSAQRRAKELERDFHASGTLVAESTWVSEQLSQEKTWYLNGQPKTHLEYQGQAFTRREFHDNGVLSFKGSFVSARSGTRSLGEHQSYDDQGRLRLLRVYNEQGQLTRERELNEAGGQVRDDALFEDGSRKAFAK